MQRDFLRLKASLALVKVLVLNVVPAACVVVTVDIAAHVGVIFVVAIYCRVMRSVVALL